jgi:pilus assembly protein CpaE
MLPALLQQAYQERLSPNYINHFSESAVRAIDSGEWERGMFAVWSPKGGVGKSFIAREMAVALGVLCHRNVLLIDADMTCGDQALYMGLSAERGGIYKLAQLYSANRKLTPALLQQCLSTYNPSSKSGSSLKVLTGAYRMSMSGDPMFNGQQGYQFARALFDVLEVMNYDFVIFDLGQSFHHPMHLTALRKCNYTFVITTSEKAAAIELAYALPELRKGMDLEREKFRLILNKWDEAMGIVPRELIDTLRIPEFARIPHEEAREVSLSLNHSKPLMLETPGKVSNAIANAIIGVFPSMETVWRSRGGGGAKQKKGLFAFGKPKLTFRARA